MRIRRRLSWYANFLALLPLVVAVAGCGGGQATPTQATAGGWMWQAGSPRTVSNVIGLTHGYHAICADTAKKTISVCTSPDGLVWTSPPDASIVKADASAAFLPDSVVAGPQGFLAFDSKGSIDPSNRINVWSSGDGVRWSLAAVPANDAVYAWVAVGVKDGYLIFGQTRDAGVWYESADARTWTPAEVPTGLEFPEGSGAAGILATTADGTEFYSADGRTWQKTVGNPTVRKSFVRRPDGRLLGFGAGGQLLESTDGLSWTNASSAPSGVGDLLDVSGTLFLLANPAGTNAWSDLWVSSDAGTTWLKARSGAKLHDLATSGGRVLVWDGNVPLVGTKG